MAKTIIYIFAITLAITVIALMAYVLFGFVTLCIPAAPWWLQFVATVIITCGGGIGVRGR